MLLQLPDEQGYVPTLTTKRNAGTALTWSHVLPFQSPEFFHLLLEISTEKFEENFELEASNGRNRQMRTEIDR